MTADSMASALYTSHTYVGDTCTRVLLWTKKVATKAMQNDTLIDAYAEEAALLARARARAAGSQLGALTMYSEDTVACFSGKCHVNPHIAVDDVGQIEVVP